MQLSTERPNLGPGAQYVAKASWVPPLLASLASFGLIAGGCFALTRMTDLPWIFWVALGPMVLIMGPLMLLIAFSFLGVFRSSLKDTNWLACVRLDGVFLNLRSYRNGHFDGDDPTVVFLSFQELKSVRRVIERRIERNRQRRTSIRVPWIEVECLNEQATDELEIACFLERTREAPATEGAGIRSRTKHHHVPVLVPTPGRVRIEWDRGLFQALSRELEVAPELDIDLDQALETLDVETRARELLRRGQRMGAVRTLRDAGWEHDEAKTWIAAERQRAA